MANASPAHRATGRVLEVFEYLASSGQTATLATLSARLAVPKSSLLPLLRTLVARGWLEQPVPATYQVSTQSLFGGRWAPARKELSAVARPFLARLSDESGESTMLAVLPSGADSVVYIDKVDSPKTVRYVAELGSTRPLHCTSSGLVVLAFMPRERRDALLRSIPLERFTARTLTSRRALTKRLDEIARDGVAVVVQEFNLVAVAVAAPIRDRDGEVHA
ncbi:MAG: IclR family transcriptional regulator, partial [Pseudomonadota bacterium]|nr:IclR family transcriptional regulator [Pseudomonadota bacterium]